jgi:hypothetical protein
MLKEEASEIHKKRESRWSNFLIKAQMKIPRPNNAMKQSRGFVRGKNQVKMIAANNHAAIKTII